MVCLFNFNLFNSFSVDSILELNGYMDEFLLSHQPIITFAKLATVVS